MTITPKQRQRSTPEYYVYYNKWTGEIITTGRSEQQDTSNPYIITTDPIAARIVNGTDSEQNYIISGDRKGNNSIVSKSEYLHLRAKENVMYPVPQDRIDTWDIRATIYTTNNKIVVEANSSMIDRLVAFNMRSKATSQNDATFEFYMVKKNHPDHLIEFVSIPADDLISHRNVVLDVGDIIPYANISDVTMLTQRYFENYYFNIINDNYVDEDVRDESLIKKWQVAESGIAAHIDFSQTDKQLIVSSVVTTEQFIETGMPNNVMEFYIVGDTPDKFVTQLSVDMAKLQVGQLERFDIDFDINYVNIMYQNPKLKVNKRKIV